MLRPKKTSRARPILASMLLGAAMLTGSPFTKTAIAADGLCRSAGAWMNPADRQRLTTRDVMARIAGADVVLLGESHTSAEDHRWQFQMLAGLLMQRPNMVIGFEMFPRSVQAALDDWSAGRLSEKEFLKAARWREVWGYGAEYYLPLFHLARQNRIPAVALNVERKLVSRVGRKGWSAVPKEERRGVGDPAAASPRYLDSLAHVFARKRTSMGKAGEAHGETDENSGLDEIKRSPEFSNFVDAQLTWDRAMAEALFDAHKRHEGALAVGVLGRGHAEFGHGVPHQLADLGLKNVVVLLPIETGEACENLPGDIADAVFLVSPDHDADARPPKPRLGVLIETGDGGVRVIRVVDGSVAEETGLEAGDTIVAAAGFPTKRMDKLVEIIQRQSPGTWLPLTIKRKDETLDLVAKFPKVFASP